ncbi:hypothetical protein ALC56_03402 [Trachymyrmex septentrionalis]|uniref:Uncharacterized protein n=1 Tax=Trachymyrmex septentrionalis TaxID=34720 RepID=A0A195FQT0_9HYME|nr:hypothetical protein ALC56_03402 [Trachymyrmex septentrionalis]
MKSVHEWGGGGSTIAALADIAGTTNYLVLPGKNVAQRIEEPSMSAATRQLCICHASLECMCIQPALEMSRNLRTLKPDGANGTSKFIDIGGLVHFFFVSVSSRSISADNCVSFMPAMRLIFQTIAFSDALYFALPFKHISCTPAVFNGVGTRTSIFCPSNEGLKFDFKTALTSIFVRPTSRTNGITRKGNDISFVSSITTTGLPDLAPVGSSPPPPNPPLPFMPLASITILSLIPNLHSGIPDK